MRFFISLFFVSTILITGCTRIGTTPLPDRSITADYTLDGIRWQDGGIMILAFKIFEKDGLVSICGARSVDKKKKLIGADVNSLALERMSITLGGQTLVSNLMFFNSVPMPPRRARSLKGQATCLLTKRAWTPEMGNSLKPELNQGPRKITVRG